MWVTGDDISSVKLTWPLPHHSSLWQFDSTLLHVSHSTQDDMDDCLWLTCLAERCNPLQTSAALHIWSGFKLICGAVILHRLSLTFQVAAEVHEPRLNPLLQECSALLSR